MDAKESREAAAVVNSPYFYGADRPDDEVDRRRDELMDLRDALAEVDSLDQLPEPHRAVYDRAKASLGAAPRNGPAT